MAVRGARAAAENPAKGGDEEPSIKSLGAGDMPPPTIGRPEMLVDGSGLMFRNFIHGLLTFFALHQSIRDSYAEHIGLGGVRYTIFQSIRHLGVAGDVGITEVANHLRLSGSFVTIEVNKLASAGLVKKLPGKEDRRRVSLKVSAKGMALLNDLAPLQRTVNDIQFAKITREEFLLMCRLIEQLIGSSEAALTLLRYLRAEAERGDGWEKSAPVAAASPPARTRKKKD